MFKKPNSAKFNLFQLFPFWQGNPCSSALRLPEQSGPSTSVGIGRKSGSGVVEGCSGVSQLLYQKSSSEKWRVFESGMGPFCDNRRGKEGVWVYRVGGSFSDSCASDLK